MSVEEQTAAIDQEADLDQADSIQFISFNVGKEIYAVEITLVREIKGWIPRGP